MRCNRNFIQRSIRESNLDAYFNKYLQTNDKQKSTTN